MAAPAALEAQEAAPLLGTFATCGAVVLAVSGGADSTALMYLSARWRDAGGLTPLHVATVDHGLRPESADECRAVQAAARSLGFPCDILRWHGEKPSTRLQERARDARFRLLAEFAGRIAADAIALAHTLDDQAETVVMRLARGSGPDGLSAMREVTRRDGLVVLRPLLGLPRARLVATLRRAGLSWIEDPSNADARFERVRARRILGLLAPLGLTPARLGRLAARAARGADALDLVAARRFAVLATMSTEGTRLDAPGFLAEPAEIRLRLIAAAIIGAAGTASGTELRLERLEALERQLSQALEAGLPLTRTLGGKLVTLDKQRIYIRPEGPRRGGG